MVVGTREVLSSQGWGWGAESTEQALQAGQGVRILCSWGAPGVLTGVPIGTNIPVPKTSHRSEWPYQAQGCFTVSIWWVETWLSQVLVPPRPGNAPLVFGGWWQVTGACLYALAWPAALGAGADLPL